MDCEETYLRIKWHRLCWFFYMLLIIHIIFVLSLSGYVVLLVHVQHSSSTMLKISRGFLLVSGAWLTMHSVILGMVQRYYFRQYEHYLNILCGVLSLAVAAFCSVPPPIWALHSASIGVLLAWLQLMMLIGRLPSYGYYALMFSTVLQNVIKVLVTFVCLVIGFALSFSIQFHVSEQFENPWCALVKTVVMMMGEFEYADMFSNPANSTSEITTRLPGTSRFIFLLFIILASIVLMNLMIGLAVSDIQELKVEGHIQGFIKQADFLTHLEKVTSHRFLKSSWFPKILYAMLESKRCIQTRLHLTPAQTVGIAKQNIWMKLLPLSLLESIVDIGLRTLLSTNASLPKVEDQSCLNKTSCELNSFTTITTKLQQLAFEVQQLRITLQGENHLADHANSAPTLNNCHLTMNVKAPECSKPNC